MDLSVLKNYGLKLKSNGSNFDPYLFKIFNILSSKKLLKHIKLSFISQQQEDGEQKEIRQEIDVFNKEHGPYLKAIATLSDEELEASLPPDYDKEKSQEAYTYLVSTVEDDLLYVFKDYPRHPAIVVARLKEHFSPSDTKSKHQLYNVINNSKITNYGGDFGLMAAEMKAAATKLKGLREEVSSTYLVSRLLQALVPYGKYSIIRSIIHQQGEMTFEAAVASIKSHLRDNEDIKKSQPIAIEAANKMEEKLAKLEEKLKKKSKALSYLRKKKKFRKRNEKRRRENEDRPTSKEHHDDGPTSSTSSEDTYCYVCGKDNHKSSDCHFRKKKKRRHRNKKSKESLHSLREEINTIKEHLRRSEANRPDVVIRDAEEIIE